MIAVVSGSGLNLRGLLDCTVEDFSFGSCLGLGTEELAGHERRFVVGRCGNRDVIVQCGRLHFYEGHTFAEVTRTVDVLVARGVEQIVFTNVVGGLRPAMQPGDTVSVRELRTWAFKAWPGRPARLEPDFLLPGCGHTGVYCWMHGPSYETPAEIRALQTLGGDVVGMSTAPEVTRCRELGIRCGVISCVTNNCCVARPLSHEDVVAVAQRASARVTNLVREAIAGGLA